MLTFQPHFNKALVDASLGVFGDARLGQPVARVAAGRRNRRRRSVRDQLACDLDGSFWNTCQVRPGVPQGTRGSVWLTIEESDDSFSESESD
jgi:hypothetical protein